MLDKKAAVWTLIYTFDYDVSARVYLTEQECYKKAVTLVDGDMAAGAQEEFDELVAEHNYEEALYIWREEVQYWDEIPSIYIQRHYITIPPGSESWWSIWMLDL